MPKQSLLRLLAPTLLMLSLWSACSKNDFQDIELDEHSAEYAFPLFSTTLRLDELMLKVLNDTLSGDTLFINPDNTMTLFYTGNVAQKPATDIFAFFQDGPVPIPDTFYRYPFNSPDGVTIREAHLKKGTITLVIQNSSPETITGTFYVPQMTKNGQPFALPFVVPSNPSFPWFSLPVELAGNVLLSDSNRLEFRYEAYRPNGERIRIPDVAPGIPGMIMSFQNLEFAYLEGYWGYSSYPLSREVIEIDINQTDLEGDVKIKNPKVTMRIANSWGFPTRGLIRYLSFIGQDGAEIPLESTVFNNDSVDFNYPSFAAGEIGQTKYTDITLDETNSNIAAIFNAQPTQLIYEVEGISNAQRDTSIIGFLTDSSVISLGVRVELLLEGSVRNFGAEQTLDLNFGSYADLDTADIESVEFKLVTENRTPIASALQMFFLDENGQAVDSLFTGGPQFIMEAAPVDAQGLVIGTTTKDNFIPMSAARFDRVRRSKTAFLQTIFTTAEGGTRPVKLLATNSAVVKMGVKVRTRL
jgi:hypothetical protein